MTTKVLERDVKAAISALLKKHGGYWVMPMTFGYGASGHPDFVGCVYGRAFGIEAKATPKQLPRPLQLKRLDELQRAGGISLVIHNENLSALAGLLDDMKGQAANADSTPR